MPATDTVDFEREFEELVRELRSLPADAPEGVRERVRSLGEPTGHGAARERLLALPWRRSLLVLAPACVLGLVAAALVHGVVNSDRPAKQLAQARTHRQAAAGDAGSSTVPEKSLNYGAAVAPPFASPLPTPNPNRYQDYEAWMRVRVKDLDSLTDRTNEAMQVVRSYGGYVASVEQSTAAGQPGQADLVLRVPVIHVEDALVRLAGLGTVVERHLSIRDLEQAVQQQRRHILQLQLQEARADLSRATSANKATMREAALSRISLTFTTQKAVGGAKKGGTGRFERALRDAGSFLAGAGAVLLFLLLVLSPLIVLAMAAFWGRRAYRRREEQRLLARA